MNLDPEIIILLIACGIYCLLKVIEAFAKWLERI
jgi:hypothetical protein